jgi:hypothetical protein
MTTVSSTATEARGPERLLPFACIAAAAVLGASEFMHTFQISQTGNVPLCNLSGVDRHHLAQLVFAGFGAVAAVIAVLGSSRPAARATALAGVCALLLFLIVDLPHANNVGSVSSTCDLAAQDATAKAVPQAGFWLELVGALGLTVSGIALATLTSEQLAAIRPRWAEPATAGGEHDSPERRRRLRRRRRDSEARIYDRRADE